MGRKLSPGFHNIRIKKPGGGTRTQRVKVLASGKFKFVKNKPGGSRAPAKAKPRKSRPKSRKTPRKVGGGSTGRRQGLASKITSAIAILIGVSPILNMLRQAGGNMNTFSTLVTRAYTGYDPIAGNFDPARLAEGYAPLAGAVGFKKAMGILIKRAPLKI